MNKARFIEAVQAAKTYPKRNFKQSFELIINLRGLNLKKPEQHIDIFLKLPHNKGKPTKVAALVGPELAEQAKKSCDGVIVQDDFGKYSDKKAIKKLASEYDYFIAQANIMPDVAKTFGRVFGPRGKMPNPKAGCVVPPNANLTQVTEKLKQTIKVAAKEQPSIKVLVGREDMADEQVAENMQAVYSNVLQKLPQEAFNIKSVQVKLTMSPPVKVTDKGVEKREIKEPEAKKPAPKKKATKKEAKSEAPKEETKEETPAPETTEAAE